MTRELAVQFPHEMCILHRSIILLFGMPTCALVSHNAYMLPHLWRRGHSALFLWCLLRVSLCVVRPYLWWHVLRVYREARLQPTPALVAQAFISAQVRSPAIRWNARLGMAYIFWLGVTSVTLFARGALWGGRDEVQEVLWNHCKLNFWSLLVQKVISILIFFVLISSDKVTRSMHRHTLEAYSTVSTLSEQDVAAAGTGSASAGEAGGGGGVAGRQRVLCMSECIICVREFAVGDEVRWLQCPHAFHVECIDEWVLKHKNRCPLCQQHIGPPEPTVDELLHGPAVPVEGDGDGGWGGADAAAQHAHAD